MLATNIGPPPNNDDSTVRFWYQRVIHWHYRVWTCSFLSFFILFWDLEVDVSNKKWMFNLRSTSAKLTLWEHPQVWFEHPLRGKSVHIFRFPHWDTETLCPQHLTFIYFLEYRKMYFLTNNTCSTKRHEWWPLKFDNC